MIVKITIEDDKGNEKELSFLDPTPEEIAIRAGEMFEQLINQEEPNF